jgi:L-lysine exporter family protein LysE/ArgO
VPVSVPLATIASGFALGLGLIVAIGAQNAFVLRQGIRREQVLAVVAVCIACDWTLITAGALGFGSVIARFPLVTSLAAWGGAAFLGVHGVLALRSALKPGSLEAEDALEPATLTTSSAVVATLGISLLNPHVYLDTVVLIGSIAAQYALALRGFFALGAGLASLVWFSALGFGARLLAPLFHKPSAWRVLDLLVAVVMWWIAATLVWGQLR